MYSVSVQVNSSWIIMAEISKFAKQDDVKLFNHVLVALIKTLLDLKRCPK